MLVTSDIFDLETIARWRKVNWKEYLLGGLDLHGKNWTGYKSGARFLLEATKLCGNLDEVRYAGYNRPGDKRMLSIKLKSFERLERGELAGALRADSVLLKSLRLAPGSQDGDILYGGIADGGLRMIRGPKGPHAATEEPLHPLHADFIFPIDAQHMATAEKLFRLAVDLLDAEYSYYFIRDDLCLPSAYMYGISAPLDYKALSFQDSEEIGDWSDYVRTGLWTEAWPKLRDLFQMNLISERHTSQPVEGLGYLHEWISAQPGRGQLQDLGRGRLLWTLTDAEIFNVRPLLHRAGLLLSCRDRVYRDLPGGSQRPSPG